MLYSVVAEAECWQRSAMTSLRTAFGRAVARLRKERGLSQEAFAEKCNIGRTYMTGIEGGKHNVSLDVIDRIARGLRVDTGELFGETERERR